jgi:flagellar biogenesis protein FliO
MKPPGTTRKSAWTPQRKVLAGLLWLLLPVPAAFGAATNQAALSPELPNVGLSVLRVFGALALVIAIFLGGVWLFRNWQRLTLQKGRAPKLNVLEARPLGNRHALYVVGYDQQRFLVAASPGGVNLLSHLPQADESELVNEPAGHTIPFAQALQQVLQRK